VHPVGSYCTHTSRCTVNKTLKRTCNYVSLSSSHTQDFTRLYLNSVSLRIFSVAQWRYSNVCCCTRVNQKVKAIFKLRGNREREELPHCAVLTMSVEEFSRVHYSALSSVEWQQRGWKHGRSFVRLHHRRTTWRSAVSFGRRSETCGNLPLTQYGQSTMSQRKVYEWVERFKSGRTCVTDEGRSGRPSTSRSRKASSPQEYRN